MGDTKRANKAAKADWEVGDTLARLSDLKAEWDRLQGVDAENVAQRARADKAVHDMIAAESERDEYEAMRAEAETERDRARENMIAAERERDEYAARAKAAEALRAAQAMHADALGDALEAVTTERDALRAQLAAVRFEWERVQECPDCALCDNGNGKMHSVLATRPSEEDTFPTGAPRGLSDSEVRAVRLRSGKLAVLRLVLSATQAQDISVGRAMELLAQGGES